MRSLNVMQTVNKCEEVKINHKTNKNELARNVFYAIIISTIVLAISFHDNPINRKSALYLLFENKWHVAKYICSKWIFFGEGTLHLPNYRTTSRSNSRLYLCSHRDVFVSLRLTFE